MKNIIKNIINKFNNRPNNYEDLPEKDDAIVSVTPRTFEAFCIMADAVEKLQLKDAA